MPREEQFVPRIIAGGWVKFEGGLEYLAGYLVHTLRRPKLSGRNLFLQKSMNPGVATTACASRSDAGIQLVE